MTDDPRTLLDTYAAEVWETTLSERPLEDFAPKAFAALRAVLDLHQPRPVLTQNLPPIQVCGTCQVPLVPGQQFRSGREPQLWPCPTVQAITSALEAQ